MDESELIERAQKLIRRYDNMKIVGSRGEWSGSARQGFNFNPLDGSGGGGGGGLVIQTGACCLDGNCSITTQVACELSGGTYMGNGSACEDQNCPSETTGACCVEENCSVTSPEHCAAIGGDYKGDNTACIPDPCEMPDCACGFEAFDGSGRRFLTQTWVVSGTYHYEDVSTNHCSCTLTISFTKTYSYDINTCDLTTTCEGFYQWDVENDFGTSHHESGDWCDSPSAGCGICAGECDVPFVSNSPPTCLTDGCSCTATQISCSSDDSQTGQCNCAAGQPPTVDGSCELTQTVTLSDECNPV